MSDISELYICDPSKNTKCKKRGCQRTCFFTSNTDAYADRYYIHNLLINLTKAIKQLIYERDCAIEDINRNATLTAFDDPYYLRLGKNEQGEEEYISIEIKTKDGKYHEIWRGIRR